MRKQFTAKISLNSTLKSGAIFFLLIFFWIIGECESDWKHQMIATLKECEVPLFIGQPNVGMGWHVTRLATSTFATGG